MNDITINGRFTSFDYDEKNNKLRLIFDFEKKSVNKFINLKMPLGVFCDLQIICKGEKNK